MQFGTTKLLRKFYPLQGEPLAERPSSIGANSNVSHDSDGGAGAEASGVTIEMADTSQMSEEEATRAKNLHKRK